MNRIQSNPPRASRRLHALAMVAAATLNLAFFAGLDGVAASEQEGAIAAALTAGQPARSA